MELSIVTARAEPNWFMKSTLLTVLLATVLAVGCSAPHKFRTSRTAGIGNSRCSLSEKELNQRRNQIARLFEEGVRETRELSDGFEFRFASDDALTVRLFEFVQAERQCCGFLTFELTLEPKPGPVWLRIRGDSDAKRSIREMIDRIGARPDWRIGEGRWSPHPVLFHVF